MTVLETNKQICRDYFKAFLARDTVWMAEHIAPDFVRHDPGLPFEVIAPQGRRLEAPVPRLFQIRGGVLVEHWALLDNLGMLKQLGAIPA